jgi:hypothetical protein
MSNTRSKPAVVRLDQLGKAARKAVKLARHERAAQMAIGVLGPEEPFGYMNPDPVNPFGEPGTIAE